MNAEACPIERIESLLLATDGSEFSEGAVKAAISLAKRCGIKLTALSVIQFNPEFEAMAPNAVEKMESDAGAIVRAVKERAAGEGVLCETALRRSETPYAAVVEEASRLKADMVVVGRRGRTGLKRLLMGSVTAGVVGHSPVNVLVAPRAASLEFKNILVAVDGSKYGEAAAREAVRIAKCTGGSVTALSVADAETKDAEANVKRVKEMAEKEGVGAETAVEKGASYEAIVNKAKEKRADLIVVGSHGKTGIKRLLMGSVTEKVIGLAEGAVLVVKA